MLGKVPSRTSGGCRWRRHWKSTATVAYSVLSVNIEVLMYCDDLINLAQAISKEVRAAGRPANLAHDSAWYGPYTVVNYSVSCNHGQRVPTPKTAQGPGAG